MIHSIKGGWYFVHVPKNAGTSILHPYYGRGTDLELKRRRVARRKRDGIGRHPWDTPLKHPDGENPWTTERHHNKATFWQPYFDSLRPVAILRNPWARCLSLYLFNTKEAANRVNKEEWAKWDHPRLVREGFKASWMPGGFFVDGHSKEIEYSKKTGRAWGQGDDQFSWLGDGKTGKPMKGAKWFRLEDQLDEFCKFTGLSIPRKSNTTTHGAWRTYYDDELVERIGKIFARDVKLGGYTPPP
jgi:hypothetical protein